MDNRVPPVDETVDSDTAPDPQPLVERRAAPRSRTATAGPRERRQNTGNSDDVVVERRKSPPRPRKPVTAERIDPLMAASSAALEQPEELVEPKPVRRKPPARKPIPEVLPEERPDEQPVVDSVVQSVVEPATTELPIIDDFFADPNPAPEPVKKRPTARVPYVLPKIIPAEPEPEQETAAEPPKPETESVFAKLGSRITYRPQFKGVTQRLQRSLQPVVLPRHRPRVRRVTRVVRHIDTWSVFKIAVLFNLFFYAVCLTAGVMLWRVALSTGTIENIERFFESFGWQTFELKGGEIYHNAWIIGLFAVVGFTGLAVLAATMFNLITDLVGGVRITVLEEEVVARELRVVSWPRLLRPATPPGGRPPSEPTGTPTTID